MRRCSKDEYLSILHSLYVIHYISCTIWCIHHMSYTILFRAVVTHASFQHRRVPFDMSYTIFIYSPYVIQNIILRISSTCDVSAKASTFRYVTRYMSYTILFIHHMSYTILFRAVVARATFQHRRVPFDMSLTICHALYHFFTICHTLCYSAQ